MPVTSPAPVQPVTSVSSVTPVTGLPSLTGLRWGAAFLVFLYHVQVSHYAGGRAGALAGWAFGPGAVGVSFFFVLSGFVLAWTARDGDSAASFWRRRIARVYPLHLVTAAAALAMAFTITPTTRPRHVTEVIANLLLVSAWKHSWWQVLNPVSWTLTCEAFFYALFPLLHAVIRRRPGAGLLVAGALSLATVIALPALAVHGHPRWVLITFPLARLPEFVLGAVTGRAVRAGRWHGPGPDVAVAVTVIGYFLTRQLPYPYAYAACTVAGFALLIPAAAVADLRGLPSPWRHPLLVRLGEWSFAFYLIHVLVMRAGAAVFTPALRRPALPAAGLALTVLTVSLLLAWALHELVEKPARRAVLLGGTR